MTNILKISLISLFIVQSFAFIKEKYDFPLKKAVFNDDRFFLLCLDEENRFFIEFLPKDPLENTTKSPIILNSNETNNANILSFMIVDGTN